MRRYRATGHPARTCFCAVAPSAEVVDIEALARAAEAAADALPAPTSDRQRLLFGRIQSLVTKTSEQASASLRFADAQVTALTAQLEARRSAAGY